MGTVPSFAWWGMGVLLLLILTQTNQQVGGWLLVIMVLGLLSNAHTRGMI